MSIKSMFLSELESKSKQTPSLFNFEMAKNLLHELEVKLYEHVYNDIWKHDPQQALNSSSHEKSSSENQNSLKPLSSSLPSNLHPTPPAQPLHGAPNSDHIPERDNSTSVIIANFSTDKSEMVGPEFQPSARDWRAREEERERIINFVVFGNESNCSPDVLKKLCGAKNLYARQLPKMPKEYIARLVFDRRHRTMGLIKNDKVVGGITFRPFASQDFVEIVFCAISSSEQVKGYGTLLMNKLKSHVCLERKIHYFLTYADNFAIGYFKKQGFTNQITIHKSKFKGFIKDYDGGTLMQCHLNPAIPYLEIPSMLYRQRRALEDKIRKKSNSHVIRSGFSAFRESSEPIHIPFEKIPGIPKLSLKVFYDRLEAASSSLGVRNGSDGWSGGVHTSKLTNMLKRIVEELKTHPNAWPFLEPVDGDVVPDYYLVIRNPIDLSLIEQRLNCGQFQYYRSKEMFMKDMKIMFDNCRTYNLPGTTYYKCADGLERFFLIKMKQEF